jgi:hypothetical protein
LIIAVTVDPTLRRKAPPNVGQGREDRQTAAAANVGVPGTADSARTAPPTVEQPPAAAPPPTAEAPEQTAPPEPSTPPTTIESSAPTAPTISPSRRRFGVSLAGQTIVGPAPNIMPGIAVYGMVALDRDSVWAPALFLGATHVWRTDIAEPDGAASFALDAGTVDACPLRLGSSRLAVRPCASGLAGRLAASGGSNTRNAGSASRPFATGGAALIAGVPLTSRIELSVRLGIGVTLVRDSYELAMTTFHRADRITTAASLGVGALWP